MYREWGHALKFWENSPYIVKGLEAPNIGSGGLVCNLTQNRLRPQKFGMLVGLFV